MKNTALLLGLLLTSFLLFSACKSKKKLAAKTPAIGSTTPTKVEAEGNDSPAPLSYSNSQSNAGRRKLSKEEVNKRLNDLMTALANDLKQYLKDVEVAQDGNEVHVIFDPGVYFALNSADLTSQAKDNIGNMSEVLSKYGYTQMLVEGHTDTTGPKAFNQTLSEKRAESFAEFAKSRGVDGSRITTKGYGPSKPRVSNATLEGRKKNRRIDAIITASEEMMRKIANGEL